MNKCILPKQAFIKLSLHYLRLGRKKLSFKLSNLFSGSLWACVGSCPYPIYFLDLPGLHCPHPIPSFSQARYLLCMVTILFLLSVHLAKEFLLYWLFLPLSSTGEWSSKASGEIGKLVLPPNRGAGETEGC